MILTVGMGLLFKKTLFRGESPFFIMELPPFRVPTAQTLAIHTWEKGKHFLHLEMGRPGGHLPDDPGMGTVFVIFQGGSCWDFRKQTMGKSSSEHLKSF